MKIVLLMGSMRAQGNTEKITRYFQEQLESQRAEVSTYSLNALNIQPCIGCGICQNQMTQYGCHVQDDVAMLADEIMTADAFFFISPIYSWYCTTPVKSLMDRLVYMMNKYYGDSRGDSFWRGKRVGVLTTCGYPDHYGADLFQMGVKRYAKHSNLIYIGQYNARDYGKNATFFNDEERDALSRFAEETLATLEIGPCE